MKRGTSRDAGADDAFLADATADRNPSTGRLPPKHVAPYTQAGMLHGLVSALSDLAQVASNVSQKGSERRVGTAAARDAMKRTEVTTVTGVIILEKEVGR